MTVDTDTDDLLPDLPPLPAVGEQEETGVEGVDEPVDFGPEERIDLDAEESPGVMDAAELIDGADEEVAFTEGSEAPGEELDAGPLVDAGEHEYGLTEGNEAPQDEALDAGIDDLGEESLLAEDAGEEGIDDLADELWHGEKDEDATPGLRPLDRAPAEPDSDDIDLGDDARIEVPGEDRPRDDG